MEMTLTVWRTIMRKLRGDGWARDCVDLQVIIQPNQNNSPVTYLLVPLLFFNFFYSFHHNFSISMWKLQFTWIRCYRYDSTWHCVWHTCLVFIAHNAWQGSSCVVFPFSRARLPVCGHWSCGVQGLTCKEQCTTLQQSIDHIHIFYTNPTSHHTLHWPNNSITFSFWLDNGVIFGHARPHCFHICKEQGSTKLPIGRQQKRDNIAVDLVKKKTALQTLLYVQ